MNVKQAKAAARRWVIEEASALPGFRGAFFHGSTTSLPDAADLPPTSDIDVMVVLADPNPPLKPGKFRYHGVLLEASYLPIDRLRTPDQVLGRYHLAGSFRTPSVIADPTGHLTALQAAVAAGFAKRRWVVRRCEDARDNALRYLRSLADPAPFHDQVSAWLFGTAGPTHVLLVAGLQNPTVRRYEATRLLLADHGRLDSYEPLLEELGCARMSRSRAEQHLAALADAFDAAIALVTTPFFFASDISDVARPRAIDGSRELIERGHQREAVFWLVATYSRCQKILHHDAPADRRDRFLPGYRRLLADLGITSPADLRRRGDQVEQSLPRVWELAEAIIAANPGIHDEQRPTGHVVPARSPPTGAA